MDSLKPSQIALMAGGLVLLIGSFLDWQSLGPFGFNAWDRGLLGFFLLVISGVAIAVGAIGAFAPQVSLPSDLLGFTPVKFAMALGAAAFLISFGLLFMAEGFKIGSILATLGSAAIAVGGFIDKASPPLPPSRLAPSEPHLINPTKISSGFTTNARPSRGGRSRVR